MSDLKAEMIRQPRVGDLVTDDDRDTLRVGAVFTDEAMGWHVAFSWLDREQGYLSEAVTLEAWREYVRGARALRRGNRAAMLVEVFGGGRG